MTLEVWYDPDRNFAARVYGHSRDLDSSTWSTHTKRGKGSTSRFLFSAASEVIMDALDAPDRSMLFRSLEEHMTPLTNPVFTPKLAYEGKKILPPKVLVDSQSDYAAMDPYQRSVYMRGNINLASEVVLWVIADRVGSWPSLVDSKELQKLVITELKELQETDQIKSGEYASPLYRAVHRDKQVPWYAGARAEELWDVASEVADVAFCSMQHWLAYDSLTIEQCVQTGKKVMEKFDGIEDKISNGDLMRMVDQWVADGDMLNSNDWPETLLGVCHLLSKRIGVDVWEALTLKCLANIRQYPQALQLVEPDRKRRMDEARTPAWVFMKNARSGFSKEKRFIPPMSDAFARETVLDVMYGSPYLEKNRIDLVALMQSAADKGLEYAIPLAISSADLADKTGQSKYY